jgi:protease-4
MNKIIVFTSISIFLIHGCAGVIPPSAVRPLTERTIGGEGRDKILVIDISGLITDKEKGDALGLGLRKEPRISARIKEELDKAKEDERIEELDKAKEDERIKAVILRINTPGGVVTTCDIIHHEIKSFKEETKTPVVAQLMGVAASGGYFIAASADKVVAHPTTVTGGVGVVAYRLSATGLMEKIGISDETVKSGEADTPGNYRLDVRKVYDSGNRI